MNKEKNEKLNEKVDLYMFEDYELLLVIKATDGMSAIYRINKIYSHTD
ncbi:hypothetical protein [Clostridium tunisiense]|nr:hypothetical protein [Clostridium tunisiense]